MILSRFTHAKMSVPLIKWFFKIRSLKDETPTFQNFSFNTSITVYYSQLVKRLLSEHFDLQLHLSFRSSCIVSLFAERYCTSRNYSQGLFH